MRKALFSLAIALTFSTPTAHAQKAPPSVIPAEKIEEARRKLQHARIGTRQKGGNYAVLAVWKLDSDDPVKKVIVRRGKSRTRRFKVQLLRRNGVNSRYRVTEPPGYAVIGIRTNVRNYGGKSWSKPAVYVPYSPEIHTARLRDEGLRHIQETVATARRQLISNAVSSIVSPTELIPDQVEDRVLVALMIVEHVMNRDLLNKDGPEAKVLIEQVLVTLGANRGDTYNYSRSHKGAIGLAQFMPKTYMNTRLRYLDAHLIRSHVRAMQNHTNAAKAQFCLADWILTSLSPDELIRLREDPEEIGAYIAAAYNGGQHRSGPAIDRFPDSWDEYHGRRGLLRNTTKYVKTFRIVYRYLESR